MPKYCSVPNCRSDSGSGGERKSFYKLPLQEPLRLQQWLRNMGRESWSPSRHQYVCHQHFAPSCFKVRWGIRYLDADAVPTIFPEAEKRKAADQREGTPKRLRAEEAQSFSVSGVGTTAPDPADAQSEPQTLRLLEFAVADPSLQGETFLMESLRTQADTQLSADGVKAGVNFPLTFYQTVDELVNGGGAAELVMMSENAAGGGQVELVTGVAAFLCPGGVLVLNDPPPGGQDLASDPEDVLQVHKGQEAVAYFETVPDVRTQLAAPPDTVLSSALSSKPIPSTLPIVSKHAPPPPPVLSPERLDGDEGEDGEDMSDADEEEQEDQQLEEHCYHKSSLSKEQLEATVGELQKKVKVLQQRHRRHLEKLLGLENTVSQLRQSNLLNEERLQLLERAYLQTSAAVSEAGGTVAIIYEEEDDAAYFYTRLDEDRQ